MTNACRFEMRRRNLPFDTDGIFHPLAAIKMTVLFSSYGKERITLISFHRENHRKRALFFAHEKERKFQKESARKKAPETLSSQKERHFYRKIRLIILKRKCIQIWAFKGFNLFLSRILLPPS